MYLLDNCPILGLFILGLGVLGLKIAELVVLGLFCPRMVWLFKNWSFLRLIVLGLVISVW